MTTLTLPQLIRRNPPTTPWSEGDNIPWHEPAFSARMLQEHLSQEHDAASRRFEIVDRHVAWIHTNLLAEKTSHILDLGCGPGLYSSRLAQLGHTCVGIDYSPASIAYARQTAAEQKLACTYIQEDLRQAEFGQGYDLAMLLYGELNVFRPAHAQQILAKVAQSLTPGGRLLLEPHTFGEIQATGEQPATWHSHAHSVFGATPHLWLNEYFWHEKEQAATIRYYIVDPDTAQVTAYAQSMQAYTEADYRNLLGEASFEQIRITPGWMNREDGARHDFHRITGVKP